MRGSSSKQVKTSKKNSKKKVYLFSFIDEVSIVSTALAGFDSSEEGIIDAGSVDSVKGDGGGSWDHVGLVDSSERNSVDLVWAGDQQEAAFELLDEDHSSASESSGKDDEDGSWGNAAPQFGWVVDSWSAEVGGDVVSCVEQTHLFYL